METQRGGADPNSALRLRARRTRRAQPAPRHAREPVAAERVHLAAVEHGRVRGAPVAQGSEHEGVQLGAAGRENPTAAVARVAAAWQ
eukprot:5656588-Prymnesium_polylepis.1